MNPASGNTTFGDGNDVSIGVGNAEQVVAVSTGGVADALSPGPHNNAHPVGETDDMAVLEV